MFNQPNAVLILILMECLLSKVFAGLTTRSRNSLNPYSNGMLT